MKSVKIGPFERALRMINMMGVEKSISEVEMILRDKEFISFNERRNYWEDVLEFLNGKK